MAEMEVKGMSRAIAIIPKYNSLFFNKLFARYGAIIKIKIIRDIFNIICRGIIVKIIFLLFVFSMAISLAMAVGMPEEAIFINSINVGVISIYIPNVSVVIALVIIIFIIIPSILVIRPPSINIIVFFINLFFILNIINFKKKYVLNLKLCYYYVSRV